MILRVDEIRCDRCGAKIDDNRDYQDRDVGLLDYCFVDLCAHCYEELDKIIKKFCKKEVE